MDDLLYLRRYRLKLGRDTGTRTYEMKPDGDGLRITFQVTHFAGGAFSIAEITMYNVTAYAAKQMLDGGSAKRYEYISLEAGFDSLFGYVFVGQITNTQRVLEDGGSTRGVRFFCRSAAKERDQRIINLSLAPETDPIQIIEACAERFGAEIQFYGDFSGLKPRSGGTNLQGSPTSCMNELAETYQFDWMVENTTLKIIKRGFAMPNEVYKISSDTGMKGSPVVSDTEVGIRYALNPKLKLGDTIQLESMAPQFEFSGAFFYEVPRTIGEGFYKINSLVFLGDSHGDLWESQISCLRLDTMAQSGISERATR